MAQTPPGSLARLDEANGLDKFRFGTPLAQYPQLRLFQDQGQGMKVYRGKTDTLPLGEATLIGVTYSFYQDKFFALSCATGAPANAAALKRYLMTHYGQPKRTATGEQWRSTNVQLQLISTSRGELMSLTSIPFSKQQAADQVGARDL